MKIGLEQKLVGEFATDAMIVPEFEGGEPRPEMGALYGAGEISGKSLEMTLLHHPAGYTATRLLLVGAGRMEKFQPADLRKLVGAAVRFLKGKSVKHASLSLDEAHASPDFLSAAVEGAILGDFEPDAMKSDRSDSKRLDSFTLLTSSPASEKAVERGKILGEAQNFARELGNEPPNLMKPENLAARAEAMAKDNGLSCEVLNEAKMKELGMGALLGVSMGSAAPPVMIILRYTPKSGKVDGPHLGLVGKGVTFDTGGISIKPADGMEKMKFDMAGGAAVVGAMQAIAKLKPNITITGIIPAVENMPGSRAQRPSDIVTTLSGKTVEVLNTDAEGRMILADALTYANRMGCTHLIDAATLTGSIVVALGTVHTGVFTNNDELQKRWMTAAQAEGEKMWPMPMDDEYKEALKSVYADMHNIGGRYGGSITAALFLQEFAGPAAWVHLDIAGTAWLDDAKPFLAKGSSGSPLRSFVRLAEQWM